jgi:hypothetical protein
MIISKTAVQRGFGCQPYKSVSFLTYDERKAVRDGELVLFKSTRLSGGNYGTLWRKVLYKAGRYIPRVPTDEEMELIS